MVPMTYRFLAMHFKGPPRERAFETFSMSCPASEEGVARAPTGVSRLGLVDAATNHFRQAPTVANLNNAPDVKRVRIWTVLE
jgi:hypothetical protein